MRAALETRWGQCPEKIYEVLQSYDPKLPLGKWFEKMLRVALGVGVPGAEIYQSVPDGRGGELDFVIVGEGAALHIECAVKFFLKNTLDSLALDSYVGPNGVDRLDLKYRKMVDIQLGRMIPQGILRDRPVMRILWMAGVIFYPTAPPGGTTPVGNATILAPNHQRGVYGPFGDVFGGSTGEDYFVKLPRQWWMTSLNGFDASVVDYFEKFSGVPSSESKDLIARIRVQDGRCIEIQRGFVI